MTEQNYYRVSVKGLVIENGKYLLAREHNGIWEIPGGGLDHNEDPIEGLKREIQEETGLTITWISDSPRYFVTCKRLDNEDYVANVIYEIKLKDLNFTPSEECEELKFFSVDEMIEINAYFNVKELAKAIRSEQKR